MHVTHSNTAHQLIGHLQLVASNEGLEERVRAARLESRDHVACKSDGDKLEVVVAAGNRVAGCVPSRHVRNVFGKPTITSEEPSLFQ